MKVAAADIAAMLGVPGDADTVAAAAQAIPLVESMARGYCREVGFTASGEYADDIAAVVKMAAARLVANPEQLAHSSGGVQFGGGFVGFTAWEQKLLNRYRVRAVG